MKKKNFVNKKMLLVTFILTAILVLVSPQLISYQSINNNSNLQNEPISEKVITASGIKLNPGMAIFNIIAQTR